MAIALVPVNDAPEVSSLPHLVTTENVSVGISVTPFDLDHVNNRPVTYSLTLTSKYGTIRPVNDTVFAASTTGRSLTVAAAYDVITSRSQFEYLPDLDYCGSDQVSIVFSDGGSDEFGGTLGAITTSNISITCVNSAPVLSVFNTTTNEDGVASIQLSAFDDDSDRITIEISSSMPGLNLKPEFRGYATDLTSDTLILTVPSELFVHVTSLAVYTPPADSLTEVSISVTVTDNFPTPATVSDTFYVAITPVPDEPLFSVTAINGTEDVALPLSGSLTTFVPADNADAFITVTLTPPTIGTFHIGNNSHVVLAKSGQVTIEGNSATISASLDDVSITFPPLWSGSAFISVTASSHVKIQPLESEKFISVTIAHVHGYGPTMSTFRPYLELASSGTGLGLVDLKITDTDSRFASDFSEVEISCRHGEIWLGSDRVTQQNDVTIADFTTVTVGTATSEPSDKSRNDVTLSQDVEETSLALVRLGSAGPIEGASQAWLRLPIIASGLDGVGGGAVRNISK